MTKQGWLAIEAGVMDSTRDGHETQNCEIQLRHELNVDPFDELKKSAFYELTSHFLRSFKMC